MPRQLLICRSSKLRAPKGSISTSNQIYDAFKPKSVIARFISSFESHRAMIIDRYKIFKISPNLKSIMYLCAAPFYVIFVVIFINVLLESCDELFTI